MSRWPKFARSFALSALCALVTWAGSGPYAAAQQPGTTPQPPTPTRSASGDGRGDPVRDLWEALSSWSLRDLVGWFAEHGVAVLVIVAVVSIILWIASLLEGRIVALLTGRSERGSQTERENRARTLVSVLHNALRTMAIAVGAIMVLEEFGAPIGPLLGGAAVVGLAIAFGAQSLIKDYFTGFMVLLEQQYMIGDVIQIGDTTGQVERITLRLTVLRDLEGRVHFIPHGQIATVTNQTHGWSQAVIDVGVAYHEDVERVIGVLMELARELRSDPKFGEMILDDPAMLGVDALGDSSVMVKFCVKTQPMRRWDVKRELLRRIKRRFDELGIEIPFPQRTVWHRRAEEDSALRSQESGVRSQEAETPNNDQ
jgi:small-conductance mechanosensitive channel